METKMLRVHIPLPIAERLMAAAEHLGIEHDAIVSEAVAVWLEREEERRLLDLRTLASANTMFIVETHRIRDWADSL
ncbi:CopG family transcriptional regulator [Rhizobium sp. SIMBA_035]|jgi:hypothetical protein|uniref:CopG family transcriptional regulator n=1 Tax=Rhizobium sp. RAF36 TaxID=3233055 RepID=UPI000DD5886D